MKSIANTISLIGITVAGISIVLQALYTTHLIHSQVLGSLAIPVIGGCFVALGLWLGRKKEKK